MLGFIFIFLFNCERDKNINPEEESYYHISGIVVDQVTQLPVVGAQVFSAFLPFGSFGYKLQSTHSVLSGQDGKFEIKMPTSDFDPSTIKNSLRFPYIYASGNDYVGSSYFIPDPKESNKIELFHTSKLSLSVKNDTVNNEVDEIFLALVGSTEFMSYPNFIGRTSDFGDPYIIKSCKGRAYEMVFEFNSLWGNLNYQILIRKPGYPWSFETSILCKPDTTVYLSIFF